MTHFSHLSALYFSISHSFKHQIIYFEKLSHIVFTMHLNLWQIW